ncbi:glycosyltransferase [Latilactobacillus curvatus]|uniref:glycosyltransferase n=1 Tax=Latilactobacillus curvatus TaxID=28038 RepID=UPI0018DD10B8|nr:glycosyltransferase [Latilactobacillus curvatus]
MKNNTSENIAILIPQFYWGGMPQVASNLIQLLEKKYNITLILVNSELEIRKETYGAKVIRLQGNPLKKLIQLRYLLKKEKYKAVISLGIIDNLLNILLAPKRTITIITEHSTKSFDNEIETNLIKKRLYIWGLKKIYPRANRIVAVSNGIKEDLEDNYQLKNIVTIYNPILLINQQEELTENDSKLIEDIRKRQGKIVINVGRITRPKGQLNLVNSFKYLKGKNIHLILIGEGPDLKEIERIVELNGMHDNIHFVGSRQNVITWMKEADIYASLSWFEGFPTALLEAISAGIPVLTADILSGPREILSNGRLKSYKKTIRYPYSLENGVLTKRFDFRESNFDEKDIEIDFARVLETMVLEKKDDYSYCLDFLENNDILRRYEEIIESK